MFQSQQQTERKDGRDIYLLLFNTQRSGKELKLCDKDCEFVSLCMSFISCTISQTPRGWNEVTGRDSLDKTAFIKRGKTKDVINKHN